MHNEEKELRASEASWSRWRSVMTLIANIHRDVKRHPQPYEPSEFVRLSFDDDIEREAHGYHPPSPELIAHLKKRFGSTIKKKNGK